MEDVLGCVWVRIYAHKGVFSSWGSSARLLILNSLEINNLTPLGLLNRQLDISKDRQKPDSLEGEGPWGRGPKGLALPVQLVCSPGGQECKESSPSLSPSLLV